MFTKIRGLRAAPVVSHHYRIEVIAAVSDHRGDLALRLRSPRYGLARTGWRKHWRASPPAARIFPVCSDFCDVARCFLTRVRRFDSCRGHYLQISRSPTRGIRIRCVGDEPSSRDATDSCNAVTDNAMPCPSGLKATSLAMVQRGALLA